MEAKVPFTRKQFFAYTLLPQFGGRLRNLIGSGFGNLAYLIALVYSSAGILPKNHEYLRTSSIGKFGIRHIIAQASKHVKYELKHIDQIIIFYAILIGIVLLGLQFVVLFFSILTNPAFAGGGWYAQFFVTPFPESDIAFRLMTMVFGVDMFGGAIPTEPIHVALYALMEFYSIGMLIVGTFIILYFATTIISETAVTGIPFGKRFSHAWVPVRLIVFFGLLIPLPDGLNGAQWITLSVAKYGSSLATNGWLRFNSVINNPLGSAGQLVAMPDAPEVQHIPSFMMVAKTCQWAVSRKYQKDVDAYVIYGSQPGDSIPLEGIAYNQALALTAASPDSPGGNIIVRFGEHSPEKYATRSGAVFPDCGEIVFKTSDVGQPGSQAIQNGYFELVKLLWADGSPLTVYARNFSYRFMSIQPREPQSPIPPANFRGDIIVALGGAVEQIILQGVLAQMATTDQGLDPEIAQLGWAGAGIWYNRIAEQNGALTAAAMNTPTAQLYPHIMEFTRQERMKNDQNILPEDRFRPTLADGEQIDFQKIGDADIARVLNMVFTYWEGRDTRNDDRGTHATEESDNAIVNAIAAILGAEGLFDMCKNTNIHPLAQLSAVGKGLIESGINNLAISAGFGIAGGSGLVPGHAGSAMNSLSGFFGTIAGIGISIGFVLYYVLPFMPFIYFFFAVGGWVKSVFEAIIGVPLWALAHLRIDAEGIPGQAAAAGYMLLFEIFMRPILIIFGLLAAIVIFASQVKALNEVFFLVVSSVSGADPDTMEQGGCAVGQLSGLGEGAVGDLPGQEKFVRNAVDEFFFTVVYAVIVYMMGMASFKLIDLIPNNMMRWFGSSASSFNDDNAPSRGAESLMKYSTIGGNLVGSQLSEGIGSVQEAFQGAGAENIRRGKTELAFLITDSELLPRHVDAKQRLIRNLEQDVQEIEEEVDNDPNIAPADKERIKIERMQELYDREYKETFEALDAKEQKILDRMKDLERSGVSVSKLKTEHQAVWKRIDDTIQSNAQTMEQIMQRMQRSSTS